MVSLETNKAIMNHIDQLANKINSEYNVNIRISYELGEIKKRVAESNARSFLDYRTDIDEIINQACKFFAMSKAQLIGNQRQHVKVSARRYIIAYLRDCKEMSFPDIGYCLSRNHTTVLHHYNKHIDWLGMGSDYKNQYKKFKDYLKDL